MPELVIVGGGAAGLTAAIYARRAGLDFVVLEQDGIGGGQIQTTDRVENYPGLYGLDGMDLAEKLLEHCRALGIELQAAMVLSAARTDDGFLLTADTGTLQTRALIYAAGTVHRTLDLPEAAEFAGRGLSYCAACDGAFFGGEDVAVVGGGDTAVSEALYLSRICRTVHLLVRRDRLRAAALLQERLQAAENILLHPLTRVLQLQGEDQLQAVRVLTAGEERTLPVSGLFVAIGTTPCTQPLAALGVCDADGLVTADETGRTAVPGLFVAGDLRRKPLRQLLTAAADGANAAESARAWLEGGTQG